MDRRQYLITAGSGFIASISGCITGAVEPSSDTEVALKSSSSRRQYNRTEEMRSDCADTSRFESVNGVCYDRCDGFTLKSSKNEYHTGERARFKILNNSNNIANTGSKNKYDIQKKNGQDWQSIYETNNWVWTYVGIPHSPGEGFTWELKLDDSSLDRGVNESHSLRVCEPISPGKYRFVFFGLDSGKPSNNSIATRFQLTE